MRYYNFQLLLVTSTVVTLDRNILDNIGGARAASVTIVVKDQSVSYNFEAGTPGGVAPTNDRSFSAQVGTTFTISGYDNLTQLQFKQLGGLTSKLYINYAI